MPHVSCSPPEILVPCGGQAGDEVCHQLRTTPLDILNTVSFGSSQTIRELHNWLAFPLYFYHNLEWN